MKVYAHQYESKTPYTDGVYLHGEVSEEEGFDLCGIDDCPTEDGIYPCTIILSNGKEYDGKLYLWFYYNPDGYTIRDDVVTRGITKARGLVVKNGDIKYGNDALKKYETKQQFI